MTKRNELLDQADDALSNVDDMLLEDRNLRLKIAVDNLIESSCTGGGCGLNCTCMNDPRWHYPKDNLGRYTAMIGEAKQPVPHPNNYDVINNPPDGVVPVYAKDDLPPMWQMMGMPQVYSWSAPPSNHGNIVPVYQNNTYHFNNSFYVGTAGYQGPRMISGGTYITTGGNWPVRLEPTVTTHDEPTNPPADPPAIPPATYQARMWGIEAVHERAERDRERMRRLIRDRRRRQFDD